MSEKNIEQNEPREKNETQQIVDFGSSMIRSSRGQIYCLTIVGQIEGHTVLSQSAKATKYEHVIPLLAGLEGAEEVDGILILLNTVGGDVEAGLAMAELIAGLKMPTVTLVLGGGHSIGVPLAVAGKRSFIVPSATMTLHPVRMNGLVIGVPQTFATFAKMQDRIIDFIVRNSRAKADRLKELMMRTDEMTTDIGTVLDGPEAVKMGLIDAVGGLGEALSALKEMIAQNQK